MEAARGNAHYPLADIAGYARHHDLYSAFIHAQFVQHIKPAIQAGQARTDVEALISEKVLAPTNELLGENDLQITAIDVLGLLYFLGGNCHIRWDKC